MKPDAILAKIRADMQRHRELFDLERDGLGAALCKAATDGVQYSIAREESPDGSPWAPLSDAYEEWKKFAYPGNPIAILHGTMANPREVAGEVRVTTDHAVVTYGVTEQSKQEAIWFQEGNDRQPPRPFWGFTAESLKEVASLLDARFATA